MAYAMKKIEVKKGDFIIRYGSMGREYYILKEGQIEVLLYEKGEVIQTEKELITKAIRKK